MHDIEATSRDNGPYLVDCSKEDATVTPTFPIAQFRAMNLNPRLFGRGYKWPSALEGADLDVYTQWLDGWCNPSQVSLCPTDHKAADDG